MRPKTLRTFSSALVLLAALLVPGGSLLAESSADQAGLSNGAQGRATVDPDGRVGEVRRSNGAQGRATVDPNGRV